MKNKTIQRALDLAKQQNDARIEVMMLEHGVNGTKCSGGHFDDRDTAMITYRDMIDQRGDLLADQWFAAQNRVLRTIRPTFRSSEARTAYYNALLTNEALRDIVSAAKRVA